MKQDFPSLTAAGKGAEVTLQRVLTALEAGIECSVGLRLAGGSRASRPEAVRAALEKAARALEELSRSRLFKEHGGSEELAAPKDSRIGALLQSISARAFQAQFLNDSAAALCRGWLAVQPLPLDDYAPQGEGVSWSTARWTEAAGNTPRRSQLDGNESVWGKSVCTEATEADLM